jgi:hypothetical protein
VIVPKAAEPTEPLGWANVGVFVVSKTSAQTSRSVFSDSAVCFTRARSRSRQSAQRMELRLALLKLNCGAAEKSAVWVVAAMLAVNLLTKLCHRDSRSTREPRRDSRSRAPPAIQ